MKHVMALFLQELYIGVSMYSPTWNALDLV